METDHSYIIMNDICRFTGNGDTIRYAFDYALIRIIVDRKYKVRSIELDSCIIIRKNNHEEGQIIEVSRNLNSAHIVKINLNKKGRVSSIMQWGRGMFHGQHVFFESGRFSFIETYVYGNKVGKSIFFYSNGKIRSIYNYLDNLNNGYSIFFRRNETPKFFIFYHQGGIPYRFGKIKRGDKKIKAIKYK